MSLSRVSHIDDTYITQPYSPLLFSQGDLPGPELLLKFQRGDLDVDDLEAAWKARRETKTRRREKWPEDMLLYCRGCSENDGTDVSRPLRDFAHYDGSRVWPDVLALGMERFCSDCAPNADKPSKATEPVQSAPTVCGYCRGAIAKAATAQITLPFCKACQKLRVKCVPCSKKKGSDVTKPLQSFELDRLLQWRKQHSLTNRAICLACAARKGRPLCKPSRTWKQELYECAVCHEQLSPQAFDREHLSSLEAHNRLYLAMCQRCTTHSCPTQQTAARELPLEGKLCTRCQRHRPLAAFSASQRRPRTGVNRICLECQYPPCGGCGAFRTRPDSSPYTCETCLYPPCLDCGKARPRNSKYRVQKLPEWKCDGCRQHLYPPCPDCGEARPRHPRLRAQWLPVWRCGTCRQKDA